MIVEKKLPMPEPQPRRAPPLDWLTRVLRIFDPARAARRIRGEIQLRKMMQARSQVFGYEAADPSRFSRISGRGDTRHADQFNSQALLTLRSQARHLERNYDLAESILTDLIANVVGEGIKTHPAIKRRDGTLHAELNKEVARLWTEFTRSPEVTRELDWGSVQQMLARNWFRDGEVFSQILQGSVPRLRHASDVMLSLELLEADMVPYDFNDATDGTVQGVRKNTWGQPTGYWVYKNHPGGLVTLLSQFQVTVAGQRPLKGKDLKLVPAARMLHLKRATRIRQTRGIPVFATILSRLEDLKDYEHSERIAARVGAAFALHIKRSEEMTAGDSTVEIEQMDLVPGIMIKGSPGESVESVKNDRPSNQIEPFRKTQLKAVAGGAGAKYSSVANDYDGSYSSQRQELVEHAVIYEMLRGHFIGHVNAPIYRAFMETVIAQGFVDLEEADPRTLFDAEHRGKGAHYIDIQKEMTADEKAVQAGFKSRRQVILERTGRDADEVFEEIVAERERDREAGLTFSTSSGGAPAANDNPPEADDAEDGDEEEDDATE